MKENRTVLIVEDSDEDFTAMMWAWEKARVEFPVVRCRNGASALEFLFGAKSATRPDLILLDLVLPGIDGRCVLAEIKKSASLIAVPVVILTSSANPKDMSDSYALGADGYVLKPMDLDHLLEIVQTLVSHWLGGARLADVAEFYQDRQMAAAVDAP